MGPTDRTPVARKTLALALAWTTALVAGVTGCSSSSPNQGPGDSGGGGDAGGLDAGTPGGGGGDASVTSVVFLHTNDVHSHLLAFGPEIDDPELPVLPPNTTPAAPSHDVLGGAKRRAKVIQDLAAEANTTYGSPVATVDSGDLMIGSLFHLGDVGSGLDYNIAHLLGYDVVTLGNHEFEFGPANLATAIRNGFPDLANARTSTLTTPVIVASNIRFAIGAHEDDALASLYAAQPTAGKPLRRYHIQTFKAGSKSVRVGFLGLMGINAAAVAAAKTPVRFSAVQTSTACTSDAQCPGSRCYASAHDAAASQGFCLAPVGETDPATFAQLVKDVAATVADLRAESVDIVVALSHAGVDPREAAAILASGTIPAQPVSEEILLALGVDQALAAAKVPGLDVIIGGHSHTVIPHPIIVPNPASGIKTAIVQAGSYGAYVGKLRLTRTGTLAGTPWTVDTAYSGLVKIDTTIHAENDLLDVVENSLIDGVETTPIATPGDGLILPPEQCDGSLLPQGASCATYFPGSTGTLSCGPTQQLDLSGCHLTAQTCGNGRIDPGEMCDPSVPTSTGALGGQTCEGLRAGYLPGGHLACRENCSFNFDGCAPFHVSLLEAVLNFRQDPSMLIRNGDTAPRPKIGSAPNRGKLFFYPIGTTSFDLAPIPFHESNLLDLITDAERSALNRIDPPSVRDPVRLVFGANGLVRDAIQRGMTGVVTLEDLFRVLPLGASPVEGTPGWPLAHFYVRADELKTALEIGVTQGLAADDFWLGVSGARVAYDLSRPPPDATHPGRIVRITLTSSRAAVTDDTTLEPLPLFDASRTPPFRSNDPGQLIHVGGSLYISFFAEAFGICPRHADGTQFAECASCTVATATTTCRLPGSVCDPAAGRCVGAPPAGLSARALARLPGPLPYFQELKEFLALMNFIREPNHGVIPTTYTATVPRRLCCVGGACPPDRTCP